MKRNYLSLFVLLFASFGIASCNNAEGKVNKQKEEIVQKESEQEETHKEPTRSNGSYDVDIEDCYYGQDNYLALENASNKFNYDITSFTYEYSYKYDYFDGRSWEYNYEGNNTIYSNDVVVTEELQTNRYSYKGLKTTSLLNNRYVYFIYDGVGVALEDCYYDTCEELDICTYGEIDDVRNIFEFNYFLSKKYGNFSCNIVGVDKNGNGIIYSIVVNTYTSSITNSNGEEAVGRKEIQSESLILFDGDPVNGSPWGIFYHTDYRYNYDQNDVWQQDELKLVEEVDRNFILSYDDELEEYEELDDLYSLMNAPLINYVNGVYIRYADATLNEEKDGFDTYGTYNEHSLYYGGQYEEYPNYGRECKGRNMSYLSFYSNQAYFIALDLNVIAYDSTNKYFSNQYFSYELTIDVEGDLPNGLHIMEDPDGNPILFSEYEFDAKLITNFSISADYDENNDIVLSCALSFSFDNVYYYDC